MSVILNIDTASRICSVAVSMDGMIDFHIESEEGMQHASLLAGYVDRCLQHISRRELQLDAVAVSIGPGSYTGLRIGLSLAKGLCFANDIPLIGVSTLELLAVKGMFGLRDAEGDEILVPMIDARRMEVYTAAYDFALHPVMEPLPLILDENSYAGLPADRRIVFIGDGVDKAREVVRHPGALFLTNAMPLAIDMVALSERAFRQGDFMDTAYGVPCYMKEYQATTPKNKVLCGTGK
ncbi:MAG: tRNA (adenosine(37)-N6)-threonylcarbamoyltransferase complex dimerization subunit type 1 TsaB [Muribaculaceae bacterium]|mgnify:FL=1